MTNRRRKKPGSLPISRNGAKSPLRLTRRDVARRELVKAIYEFFCGADPVVIHLLASASRDISAPVAKAAGRPVFGDHLDKTIVPEYREAMKELLREPYNFFKHGGADPDKELPYFDPASNDMLLLEACADYREAFGTYEREMSVFLAWHVVTYPDLLNEEGKELLQQVSAGFEGLDASGRLAFGRKLLDAIQDGLI